MEEAQKQRRGQHLGDRLRPGSRSHDLDLPRYPRYPERMTKVLVSFDDALLHRIDRIARGRGLTRSAYLAGLAERDIARLTGPGTTPAARRALVHLDELFEHGRAGGADSTTAVRSERDAR